MNGRGIVSNVKITGGLGIVVLFVGAAPVPAGAATLATGKIHRTIYITASDLGTGGRGAWSLTLGKDGRLFVDFKTPANTMVSRAKMTEIIGIVEREAFGGLADEYGTATIEGPLRVLDVTLDGKRKRVQLFSNLKADSRREEVKRALRVWLAVRNLFERPGAADSREADRTLLNQ